MTLGVKLGVNESLEIWAPRAQEVAVEHGGVLYPARRCERGYYEVDAPPIGSDYYLVLDGRRRPDPRSALQPHGVHGPSRRIAHDFAWQDGEFRAPPLASGVIYELHVGTFTAEGTFAAATDRLADLAELGVTHVELMPVASFPGQHGWGYDGVCLWAPHPAYGTPDELKRLVARAHALGLAVLLDVVYNHLGPDGNYLAELGPYFTERYRTPWGSAVNLDEAGSDEVRKFFVDNACMWLRDYHFDGLRLDAVHAFADRSARHFLEQLSEAVAELSGALGRPLVLIGESDLNDPRLVRERVASGYGLDAQWSDDLHHALHAALTGERSGYYADFGALADIVRTLREGYAYAGRYSRFRERTHGRPLAGVSSNRLLGYLQTHDQVGNRARGERIAMLTSPGRARIGAAIALCAPCVPMLFQGEEWAASSPFLYFTDHQSPELAQAVREGRQAEFAAFGWAPQDVPDPQAPDTFRASVLDWSERQREPHAGMLQFYRALIALRRSSRDLQTGDLQRVEAACDDARGWLSLRRGAVTLQANLGAAKVVLPAPPGRCVLAHPSVPEHEAGGVALLPDGCALWLAE